MMDNFGYCVMWFLSYPMLIWAVALTCLSLAILTAFLTLVR